MKITLKQLFKGTEISLPEEAAGKIVTGIVYDSRLVEPGVVFVAVKGFSSDGHMFVKDALASGAVAVITEYRIENTESVPVFVNPGGDNRSLLADISAVFYRHPWDEMKTVGITGTNGKTSTAHMLRWILSANEISTGIMGTVGHIAGGRSIPASVTTPDSLEIAAYMREMADSGDKVCVMEVSSHALALSRVRDVRFDVTLFTNISQDHLDFHTTMEEYLETKKKLFNHTKQKGTKITGTYAPGFPQVQGAVTFGERACDTYTLTDIQVNLAGSTFILDSPGGTHRVSIQAPGRFNVYNAAGALAAAESLGVPLNDAIKAVGTFPGVPGRMERVDCGQKFLVAVDYAHTPDALERVLKQGSILAGNRLISVFGCGGDRDNKKRPVMGKIAVENSAVTIVTSDNPRTEEPSLIIDEIIAGIPSEYSPLVIPDRAEAIRKAIGMAEDGDVVIIAGKGHEDYQILGTRRIHFDDREKAREALSERGYSCVL